jgi:hypothetical protein
MCSKNGSRTFLFSPKTLNQYHKVFMCSRTFKIEIGTFLCSLELFWFTSQISKTGTELFKVSKNIWKLKKIKCFWTNNFWERMFWFDNGFCLKNEYIRFFWERLYEIESKRSWINVDLTLLGKTFKNVCVRLLCERIADLETVGCRS